MKAFLHWLLWLIVMFALEGLSPGARAAISWRVSVKMILDNNGNLPVGNAGTNDNQSFSFDPYNYDTPERVRQIFSEYNQLLERMGWAYRIELTEVVQLSGLSQWFNRDARDGETRAELEVKAKLQPALYLYRPNAINLYINNGSSGISGGHLPLLGDVIMVGATGYWGLALHEIGHALGLCHTQGCGCGGCSGDPTGSCNTPGDDGFADTLPDTACSDTNDIARAAFGRSYTSLNSGEKRQVDDTWFNLMSYHNIRTDRLTRSQWERIVDVSNFEKLNVVSGRTYFVDRNNPCGLPQNLIDFMNLFGLSQSDLPLNPFEWGTRNTTPQAFCMTIGIEYCFSAFCLGGPHKSVGEAIQRAGSGDRLQIKAGSYNERIRITKALTLATDRGTATIGR